MPQPIRDNTIALAGFVAQPNGFLSALPKNFPVHSRAIRQSLSRTVPASSQARLRAMPPATRSCMETGEPGACSHPEIVYSKPTLDTA